MYLRTESLQSVDIPISSRRLIFACLASRGVSSQFALGEISFIYLSWSPSSHQHVSVLYHFDSGHLPAQIVLEGVSEHSFW